MTVCKVVGTLRPGRSWRRAFRRARLGTIPAETNKELLIVSSYTQQQSGDVIHVWLSKAMARKPASVAALVISDQSAPACIPGEGT